MQQASILSGHGIDNGLDLPGLLRISGAVDCLAIQSFHFSNSASNERCLVLFAHSQIARPRSGDRIAFSDSLTGWEHTKTASMRLERSTGPPRANGEPIRCSTKE